MKRIEIIIPDGRLHDVNNILKEANVGGISYHRIEGRGKAKIPQFISRFKVEVVVRDEQVEGLITKIVDKVGGNLTMGGKIFVVDVPIAVDLATKKRGDAAI